ncbi:hypothetical protein [Nocardia sp. CA-290969]|uniref:hypothetical protein n=1 Tax=Nocardia sp. CA-290969 TaxID=3239986 RepID=UPI003D92BF1C
MSRFSSMTGMTNPAHYAGLGAVQARLRADFAHYWLTRDVIPDSATPQIAAERTATAEGLAATWKTHPKPHLRAVWQQLQTTADRWKHRPEVTRRMYEQLTAALPPGRHENDPIWRTLRDTGLITERLDAGITGSGQDQARWYPHDPTRAPGRERAATRQSEPAPVADSSERATAFDRALGGRAKHLASMVEVEAVIARTDALLGEEGARGDLDTGAEARAALLPAERRTAPITYDYGGDIETVERQIAALRQLQDLTAEHTRLAGRWEGTLDADQDHIGRLESLIAAIRSARTAAAGTGAADADIDGAYHAGLDGAYWSDRPGSPGMGRLAYLIQERDNARASTAVPSSERAVEPALTIATEFGVAADRTDGGGAAISDAVDAAFPDLEPGSEFWDDTDLSEPRPPAALGREVDLHP